MPRSLLPMLLLFPLAARADYDLTLLDDFHGASTPSSALVAPIIDPTGDVYWEEQVTPGFGAKRLIGNGATLAEDETIPTGAGDFPLTNLPSDALNGAVLLLGQHSTPAPGGGGGFLGTPAIYEYPGLARLAYYGTPFPGFTNDPVSLVIEGTPLYDSDQSVVFTLREAATPTFRRAIVRLAGGTPAILAETGVTAVPGTAGTFTTMLGPRPSAGRVLFYGEGGGRRGVYLLDDGNVETVVDNLTVLPPNASPVSILDAGDALFDLDGDDVVVTLTEIGGGVWTRISGQWSRVIARTDTIPSGSGFIAELQQPAIRDGKVAFIGGRNSQFSPPIQWGVYSNANANGPLEAVVNLDTDFGVDVPTRFNIGSSGRFFDGTDLVFAADNGSWRAIYRATAAPEPGATALAIAALCAIRWTSKRS